MRDVIEKKGLCGMCRSQCAIKVKIQNGKIIELKPDHDSPRGRLCKRGTTALAVIYGEDRITEPLIRVGKKGENQFRKATWEEALTLSAKGFSEILNNYGPRALASYFGQGVLEDAIMKAGDPFWGFLGSPNDMSCGSICNVASSSMGPVLTLGFGKFFTEQDLSHSDVVFVWGKNPKTDDGPEKRYQKILDVKKRGGKVVVIDPLGDCMGGQADIWIPVIPGSDGALAICMLKRIVESERYDGEFVADYTYGFQEFKEYLAKVNLDIYLEYCGVTREELEIITDLFCSTEKITLIAYTGLEYQLSGIQAIRAIYLLWCITGKIDVEGGIYIDGDHLSQRHLYQNDPDNLPLGAENHPLFSAFTGNGLMSDLPKAVLQDDPYPVRGLLMTGGSPIVTYPDSHSWRKTYENLDFMLVLERYMTEDAKYADVILPATTWYENASVLDLFDGWQLRDPFIEPVGNCRNDVLILQALAEKMGFGDKLPKDNEAIQRWALEDSALYDEMRQAEDLTYYYPKPERTYKKYETGVLRADGKPGFPTPTGKIEIDSTILRDFGYEGLPVYEDMRKLFSREAYPFVMTTGARNQIRIGSFGQNIPAMASLTDSLPYVEMNAEDMGALGLKEEEPVHVITPFGKKIFYVKESKITLHCIHIQFGGGSSFMSKEWEEGNVNDLCSLDFRDPISGFVTIKSIPCRIEPME